jgi:hypothetical protein
LKIQKDIYGLCFAALIDHEQLD